MITQIQNWFSILKMLLEHLYLPVLFETLGIGILVWGLIKHRKKRAKKIQFKNHEYLKILKKYREKMEICNKHYNNKPFILSYLFIVEHNLTQMIQTYEKENLRRANDICDLLNGFFYDVQQNFEIEMLGQNKSYEEIQDFIKNMHDELGVMKNEILMICLSDAYLDNDLKMSVILDIVLTFIIININKLEIN